MNKPQVIYRVELRFNASHKQVRHFTSEASADKVIEEFEKKHPLCFANKYTISLEE